MSSNDSTMITSSRERGQHLKFEDRVSIKIYRKLKYTLRAIADVLDCSPSTIQERAQNERHNRILRRYIPKGVSIDLYFAEQILHFADEMNALPRKQLGYRTPDELFEEFLDKVYSLDNPQVA